MIKNLFEDLKAQILAEAPTCKTVRLWNNQLNNEARESSFLWPAVFIEFSDIDWEDTHEGVQEGDVEVTLHQVYKTLKDEDLALFDYVCEVHAAVQGFDGEHFTALGRTEGKQDTNHDGAIDWQTKYDTRVSDGGGYRHNTSPVATITSLVVNADLDVDNEVIGVGDGIP